MKIGVADISGDKWTGGQMYASVAVQALSALALESRVLEVLVLGQSDPSTPGSRFVAMDPDPPTTRVERLARRVVGKPGRRRALPGERRIRQALNMKNPADAMWLARRHGCDAVFPVTRTPPRRSGRLGVVSWVPDLQHATHPEYFSRTAAAGIDAWISRLGERSHRLVVSSGTVRAEFVSRFPQYESKLRVLPFPSRFAFAAPDELLDVRAIYGLPERFFVCPNQFWRHKNHELALEALALAVQEEPEITCVFTGMLSDGRDPSSQYLSNLLQLIAKLRLEGRAKILGLVPRDHLDALIATSEAVVQPSLSEGWSTTVQDAKALGVPILALDTPVLREQAPNARFFVNEPSELSRALLSPPKRIASVEASRRAEAGFAREFALNLLSICEEAANEAKRVA